jgi:hypothetical protein
MWTQGPIECGSGSETLQKTELEVRVKDPAPELNFLLYINYQRTKNLIIKPIMFLVKLSFL